ncbi:MAG: DUF1499 domain-containing protein [Pseudomonadota bacterium]
MSETIEQPQAGWRMKVAIFALAASIFSVLWLAVAALGTKFGFWPWQVGLSQMSFQIAPMIIIIALGASVVALTLALWKSPRFRPAVVSLAAGLIALSLLGRMGAQRELAYSLPPIHDIQTDWNNPIQFSSALIDARNAQGGTNEISDAPVIPEAVEGGWPGMGGKLVSVAQEEAEAKESGKRTVYPKMESLYFSQSPTELAAAAEQIINKRGWEIVASGPTGREAGDELQIDATATSGWFGFKDDIAVRISPVEGAVKVDIRSTSRVGLSDLGANSTRVYGLMIELEDRADGRRAP